MSLPRLILLVALALANTGCAQIALGVILASGGGGSSGGGGVTIGSGGGNPGPTGPSQPGPGPSPGPGPGPAPPSPPPPGPNSAPSIQFSRGNAFTAATREQLRFTVSVSDPDAGQQVAVRLLNVPTGVLFAPIRAATPASRALTWEVPPAALGRQRLLFEVSDGVAVIRTEVVVEVVPAGAIDLPGTFLGDVTGDGLLDVVGAAPVADTGGMVETGALFVWAGTATPTGAPTASLIVPGAGAQDRLGGRVELLDLTGDGVLDVVARADRVAGSGGGAFHVWAGGAGLTGPVAPTATLRVPTGVTGDALGRSIRAVDVSGDGLLDLVVAAPQVDVGGVTDTGAIYVWLGGPGLTGLVAPHATLTVPGAESGARLGDTDTGAEGVLIDDVTGDDLLDVVACAPVARVNGVFRAGAIYVWAGGPGLAGDLSPLAALTVSGAAAEDELGHARGAAVKLVDVSGDGVRDIVAVAQSADAVGRVDVGAAYVWLGGATLVGSLDPAARLLVPGAVANDRLGHAGWQGLELVDLSDDGILDVVIGAHQANVEGVTDAGAVYLWKGGPTLAGVVAPDATLRAIGPLGSRELGNETLQRMQIGDVTGDGIVDLVVSSTNASPDGVSGAGALYLWAGGGPFTGSVDPTAVLRVPGAAAGDSLGLGLRATVFLEELTGDGVLDVVACSVTARRGTVGDAGALYVWQGGPGLVGAVGPIASLSVLATPGVHSLTFGGAIRLVDVSGDGIADVVCSAGLADLNGVTDTGVVCMWRGGPGLVGDLEPTAVLQVSGAAAEDRMPLSQGEGLLAADWNGDGILDVVAGTPLADVGGLTDVGAIYVWLGGPALTGTLDPSATLRVAGAVGADSLAGFGQGVFLADVTGDGAVDVIGTAPLADVNGVVDAGAIYLWTDGTATGVVQPTATLTIPGAQPGDRLAGR